MARKLIATAAHLEKLMRLGLIDSPEDDVRRMFAEENEDRESAKDSERGRKSREGHKQRKNETERKAKIMERNAQIAAEYERRTAGGEKAESVVADLCAKHGVARATIFGVIPKK